MKAIEEANIDKRWLNLGAETQSQNRLNREYMDSLMFEMRLLGSDFADTSTRLFGVDLPAPIMPAAMMNGRVWDKLTRSELWNKRSSFSFSVNYLEEVTAGVTEAKSMMWLGVHEENAILPHIIDAGAKVALMVKPLKDKEKACRVVQWGEKLGCVAVGVDIDAMFGEKSFDEIEGPPNLGPQSIEDLKRYKEATSLPFIIKGVLSVRDAKISKDEIGADCIVVSTHGGEAIDYSIPILKVLPEIRKTVGKDIRILVDTGFRRGTDVLKALALGADGACFGSLMVVAFAAYGRDGVANMLLVLYKELQRAMTLTGCKSITDIDPSIIRFP